MTVHAEKEENIPNLPATKKILAATAPYPVKKVNINSKSVCWKYGKASAFAINNKQNRSCLGNLINRGATQSRRANGPIHCQSETLPSG
jgi:hypothetical protein